MRIALFGSRGIAAEDDGTRPSRCTRGERDGELRVRRRVRDDLEQAETPGRAHDESSSGVT